jgi:putative peptidoglycan lipid II flippase
LQRVFFSLDDTKTPFFLQLVHAGIFVILVLQVPTLGSDQIALGVAVATSIAATAQLVVGLIVLRRRLRGIRLRRIVPAFAVFFFAAALASGVGIAVLFALFDGGRALVDVSAVGAGAGIVLITVVMAGVYSAALWLARNSEFSDVVAGFMAILRRVVKRGE